MKILHIFGVVLAVHLGVFLVIFAVPGCRTPARKTPPTPADTIAAAPAAESPEVLAAAPLAESASPLAAVPEVPSSSAPVDATVRFSPTRPGTPAAGAVAPATVDGVTPARTHTVVRGDSLWTVAKRYNLTVAEVAAANQLSQTASLKIGQKLMISAAKPVAAAAGGVTAAAAARHIPRMHVRVSLPTTSHQPTAPARPLRPRAPCRPARAPRTRAARPRRGPPRAAQAWACR